MSKWVVICNIMQKVTFSIEGHIIQGESVSDKSKKVAICPNESWTSLNKFGQV